MKGIRHQNDPKRRRVKNAEIVGSRNERARHWDHGKEQNIKASSDQGDRHAGDQKRIVPKGEDNLVEQGQAFVASGSEKDASDVVEVWP